MILARSQERAFFCFDTAVRALGQLVSRPSAKAGISPVGLPPIGEEECTRRRFRFAKTLSCWNGRPATAVGGFMLFYHFTVCRQLDSMACAEANVMVRVDDDVEKSTESAVQFLHELGWEVQEVRHAQMAESADEFAGDADLVRLYQDASREGVACAVGGIGFTSRRTRDIVRAAS